ncbi:MAG: hypothetical protein DRN15_10705 [Thermoprotei archaeon]|nr:MAG: hypothetical protein DRN15_10705 [Thermoprotei archaeon]
MSVEVVIQVKDTQILLDEFDLKLEDLEITDWRVGGITDPLGQLISWLWEQASAAFSALEDAVWGFLVTIRNQITDFISDSLEALSGTLSSLIGGISSTLAGISEMLTANFTSVLGSIASLGDVVSGFFASLAASLSSIGESLLSAVSGLSDFLGRVWEDIKSSIMGVVNSVTGFLSHVYSALSSALASGFATVSSLLQQAWNAIVGAVQGVANTISAFVSQIYNALVSNISALGSMLTQVWNSITGAIQGVFTSITAFFSQIYNSITSAFVSFTTFLSNLGQQLWGYVSGAIAAFQKGFEQTMVFFRDLYGKLKQGLDSVQLVLQGFVNPLTKIWEILGGMYETLTSVSRLFTIEGLLAFLANIFDQFMAFIQKNVVEPVKKWVEGVIEGLEAAAKGAFQTLISGYVKALGGFKDWFRPGTPPPDPSTVLNTLLSISVPWILGGLGMAIITDVIQTEVQVMGTKASVRLRTLSNILSSIFNAECWIMPLLWSVFQATVLPAMSLWFNYNYRTRLPEEEDMLRFYYWGIVPEEGVRTLFQLYGYSDELVKAFIETSRRVLSPEELVDVYYRLKNYGNLSDTAIRMALPEREIEISLADFKNYIGGLRQAAGITNVDEWFKAEMTKHRYTSEVLNAKLLAETKLPSPSDLITFVVREIITPQDFFVAMQMQNYHPYWASAYWEAHWRLPSFENLRKAFFRGIINAEEFKKFVIWHDYRPFPRPGISKSDVEIMMALQYELPTRIDTRWMVKYGIIDFNKHRELVKMEGYHPDWIDNIAKAEVINVVVDERTLWRNRLFDKYELGMLTKEDLESTFRAGFKVTVDGVEFKVGFHPLEIALMMEAAKHEREAKLAEDYLDELIAAYREGAISLQEFKKEAGKYIKDSEVLEAIIGTLAIRKLRETVRRVRSEAESAIDRWLYLYERGYASEAEVMSQIKKLIAPAKMEKEELEAILSQVKARRTYWERDAKADRVKRLYQYARVSDREYMQVLKQYGWPEAIIKLELEAYDPVLSEIKSAADDIAEAYERGKIDRSRAVELMRKLGVSDYYIQRRLAIAEVRKQLYAITSSS